MIKNKKVVVVMPAYNAEKTLEQTYREIDTAIVDEIVVVDDCSRDATVKVAKELGLHIVEHKKNRGYGGNQKSCYKKALELGADIVIMLHPDYQYTPKLIPAMSHVLASELYDVVLGSRILSGGALAGGMPIYKYIANRILTFIQNLQTGMKLSEYHTGYRAFTKKVLTSLHLENNDDDFIFDNQMLLQIRFQKFRVAEVTCPTKYFEEASSINFSRSSKYGLLCIWYGFLYMSAKAGFYVHPIFHKLK
ncbi:MAG: glycosyltransferase family 2 protein [Oligoflexia bacterium]|nr:glycosyltransferase family 2 protein [Oligoflexia bacterium]